MELVLTVMVRAKPPPLSRRREILFLARPFRSGEASLGWINGDIEISMHEAAFIFIQISLGAGRRSNT